MVGEAEVIGFFVVGGAVGFAVGGVPDLDVGDGMVAKITGLVGLELGIVTKARGRVVVGARVAIVVVSRSSVAPGPGSIGFHGTYKRSARADARESPTDTSTSTASPDSVADTNTAPLLATIFVAVARSAEAPASEPRSATAWALAR